MYDEWRTGDRRGHTPSIRVEISDRWPAGLTVLPRGPTKDSLTPKRIAVQLSGADRAGVCVSLVPASTTQNIDADLLHQRHQIETRNSLDADFLFHVGLT